MASKNNQVISETMIGRFKVSTTMNCHVVVDVEKEDSQPKRLLKTSENNLIISSMDEEKLEKKMLEVKPPSRKELRDFQKQIKKVVGSKQKKRDEFYQKLKDANGMVADPDLVVTEPDVTKGVSEEEIKEVVEKIKGKNDGGKNE